MKWGYVHAYRKIHAIIQCPYNIMLPLPVGVVSKKKKVSRAWHKWQIESCLPLAIWNKDYRNIHKIQTPDCIRRYNWASTTNVCKNIFFYLFILLRTVGLSTEHRSCMTGVCHRCFLITYTRCRAETLVLGGQLSFRMTG